MLLYRFGGIQPLFSLLSTPTKYLCYLIGESWSIFECTFQRLPFHQKVVSVTMHQCTNPINIKSLLPRCAKDFNPGTSKKMSFVLPITL